MPAGRFSHRDNPVFCKRSGLPDGLVMEPRLGEAWWSLADLKTVAFSDADVEVMQATWGDDSLPPRERAALRFALGKAFEHRGEVEAPFEHYRQGNGIRHGHERFDVERFEAQCAALRDTFMAETTAARQASAKCCRPGTPDAVAAAACPVLTACMVLTRATTRVAPTGSRST